MVSPGNFLPEIELRRHHAGSEFSAQAAGRTEALPLRGGRAGDHDHAVEMRFNSGLIQQGNVEAKPVFAGFCSCRERAPAFPDDRVQDRFELSARFFIVEDTLAQAPAIGRAVRGKDAVSERFADLRVDAAISRKRFMRALVGIEKPRRKMTQ